MSTGPFTMQPGDEQEIVFAVIWTRGKNNLHSVTRLRDVAEGMRAMTDDLLHPYEAAPAKAPAPEFTFAPSYPNPFRGTTTLHYSLPEAARVRLVVYDVLGREVAHLVDKVQAAGAYTVAFDAEELPSGMYVGSLEVAGHRFTQPLIVH